VLLVRGVDVPFAPRREEGLLQERDLFGGAFELLVIVLDRRLLLGDEFSQLNDQTPRVRRVLWKIGTSVLHAFRDAPGRRLV
jgi:hypothetical protein